MADNKSSWSDWGKKKKDKETHPSELPTNRDTSDNDPYKKAAEGASGKKQLEKLKKFFGVN